MGKRGGARKAQTSATNNNVTLREETTGKMQTKRGSSNAKHMLKVEHLERLAVWAGGEASMPSLGAFFGHKLASVGESLGVPRNTSLFLCHRCETVLQPGFNCTVRIENNKAKPRRRSKKPCTPTRNNVVYACHFCSHRNLRRGTPKGHMKEICPSKIKTTAKSKLAKPNSQKPISSENVSRENVEVNKTDESALPPILATSGTIPNTDAPATPIARTGLTLLEGKKRKRNKSTAKKLPEPEKSSVPTDAENTIGMSRKRRRKSWTSLKELAESSEKGKTRNLTDLPIPFFL